MNKYKITTTGMLIMALLFIGFSSCKKLDSDAKIAAFGDVFFISKSENPNLEVKYNGYPIKWDRGSGKIRTLEGEGSFEFYDKETSVVFATKKINIKPSNPETYLAFQPTADSPIAFLDPNAQANVSAPEAGFMKIKVANYAPNLLPFSKIDVVVHGYIAGAYVKVGTIENIGQNLDTETYHLVSKGNVPANRPNYKFTFVDHVTKQEIKNFGGTTFDSTPFSARASKGIFTIYMIPIETFENDLFIKYKDIYYGLQLGILFQD